MSLQAMYSQFTDNEAVANRFGAISDSHHIAIKQIKKYHLGLRPDYRVLDLSVGNGAFLQKLSLEFLSPEFTGIDISTDMLRHAQATVPLKAIEASAAEADRFLPPHSQDLVLAHFINANISLNTIFNEAKLLTRANGHFSLITTTYDSFPVAQQKLAEFIAKDSILSSVIGHYYKAIARNTSVAASEEQLLLAFQQHQFQVLAHKRLEIPIILNNIEEFASFGIDGTWFLNSLPIRMLPKYFLIKRLKRVFNKIFTFPYHDTHIIDIVLAKK